MGINMPAKTVSLRTPVPRTYQKAACWGAPEMVWAVLAWTAMLRPRPLLGLRVFVQRECPTYDNLKLPVVGPFFAPGCSGGALAIWGPFGPYIKGRPPPARKAFSLLVYFYLLSIFDGSSSCSCAGFAPAPAPALAPALPPAFALTLALAFARTPALLLLLLRTPPQCKSGVKGQG